MLRNIEGNNVLDMLKTLERVEKNKTNEEYYIPKFKQLKGILYIKEILKAIEVFEELFSEKINICFRDILTQYLRNKTKADIDKDIQRWMTEYKNRAEWGFITCIGAEMHKNIG